MVRLFATAGQLVTCRRRVLVRAVGRPARDFVNAAVGDAAQLLDVDVDRLARASAFVAADGLAGGPIHGGQWRQAVPDQDAAVGDGPVTRTVMGGTARHQ